MRPLRERRTAIACFVFVLCLTVLPRPAEARERTDSADACAAAIERAERSEGVPHGLLSAIAFAESGRWDAESRSRVAWPWTVNANGEGMFFHNKNQAMSAVSNLLDEGSRLIDVGCMQVNLHYHGDAFGSLDEAFDPGANARYAARFLRDLYAETGSWQDATMRYHSATPELGIPYRDRVMALWQARPQHPPTASAAATAADTTVEEGARQRFAIVPVDMERTRKIRLFRHPDASMATASMATTAAPDGRSPRMVPSPGARRSSRTMPGDTLPLRNADEQATFAARRQQVLRNWRIRDGAG
jgi:Transglycosylase SLT domain